MADATTEMILRIRADVDEAQRDIGGLGKQVDNLGQKTKKTSDGFTSGLMPSLSKAAIGAGVAAAAFSGITKAVTELMAREDALADFSAITGVTGAKLQEFGTAAEELSNKFGTGVIENIEAFKGVLSRLGPDFASSSEAVKAMGDNINTLSKASGLDAVASMDALTTAMLQFGVDLSDPVEASAEAARMMNVMAAGAKEGAAEIPQINEALKQVGITASELNISFEETNAAIQVLAAGGKTGSEAGVALRNVMVSLTKGTKQSDAALAKIGLTTEELGKVMTEQGLEEALRLFNSHLGKMPSLADQAALKAQVFGKENLAAAGKLIKSADAMGELTGKVTDTSTAYDQSAIKMATASEKMNRALNSAWNDIVKGVGSAGNTLAEGFNLVASQTEQAASAIGSLLQLDLAGFWDTATMSVGDYNSKKEKQLALEEQNYRLLIKQADADIKRTGQRKELLDLQNELVGALKKVEGVTDSKKLVQHMDEFKEMFNKGTISSVDEYFLSLKKGAADSGTESEKAAKKAKQLTEQVRSVAAALDINNLNHGMEKYVSLWGQWFAFQDNTQTAKLNEMLRGLNIQTIELSDSTFTLEKAFKKTSENSAFAFDMIQTSIEGVGVALGSIASGSTADAWKSLLRMILNAGITALETQIHIVEGFSIASAIATAGASLIKDAPLIVAAYGALELARGMVNSFRTGIDYVPTDAMPAILHKGEAVLKEDEAERYRRGQAPMGSGNKGKKTVIAFSRFESVIEDNHINTARRYA